MERNNSSAFLVYHPKRLSDGEASVIVLFMAVTFIAALLGNTIVIGVISRVHSMLTATNMLLINLSVADLVIATLNLPLKTVAKYIVNYWPFGNYMCKLIAFCQIMVFFVSILSLVAVAYERYTTVCKPMMLRRFSLTPNRVKYVVGVIWIAGATGAAPMLRFFKTTPSVCPDGRGTCEYCASTGSTIDALKVYSVVVAFAFFLFPLSVMSFAYLKIGQKVWQSARNTSAMRRSRDNERATKSRITKISLAMILSFVIAWGPTFGQRMYDFLSGVAEKTDPEIYRVLYPMFHCLQYSNCALNPLLYSFMSERFRQAFGEVYRQISRGSSKSSESGFSQRRSDRFTRQLSLSKEGRGGSAKPCDDKMATDNQRASTNSDKNPFFQETIHFSGMKRALLNYESAI